MSIEVNLKSPVRIAYRNVPIMGIFKVDNGVYIKIHEDARPADANDIFIGDEALTATGDTSQDAEVEYLGIAKITIELED